MKKGLILFVVLLLTATAVYFGYQRWNEPIVEALEEHVIGETPPLDTIPHIYLYDICIDSLALNEYTIERGESFGSILRKHGISPSKQEEISQRSDTLFNVAQIRAGKRYYILTPVDSSAARYLIYQRTVSEAVVFDLSSPVKVYEAKKPITLKRKYAVGEIKSSLWGAIKESGADPILALMLSDVFAWTLDFFDLKKGDSFKVLYEQAYVDDTTSVEIASIQGALFRHDGKDYYAIPFMQDSVVQYFDTEGKSLRRMFLKAPLKFSRVTSGFSHGRMHPILKILRPHHGIDYAAPTGTPVFAVGDGTVVTLAHQGAGAGRYVVLQHPNDYTTTYMHLSKYAKELKVGSRVKQGDVIGYVGSSGMSTGSHLDFRVHKGKRAMNPMKLDLPPLQPVKPELLPEYERIRTNIIRELEGIQ